MKKSVLITGGAGFIGSNLAIKLKKKYSGYEIIVFDNLKRRGSELNLPRLKKHEIVFLHGDIRCKEDFEQIGPVNSIIDASAEPSVLTGIEKDAEYLINTNLYGTINCLYFAQRHKADFIFLSTSRVYPIKLLNNVAFVETDNRFKYIEAQIIKGVSENGVSEKFPLEGSRSLYGATKLAAEILIKEYNELLNIKAVINRCGVIAGPWQMGKVDQGFVALWVAKHFWKQPLSYIGYGGLGKQVRDILHIDDLFKLIDYQLHNMNQINGDTFNIGGGLETSVSLKEMTKLCEEITGNKIKIDNIPQTRIADLRIYYSDNTKAKEVMNWQPTFSSDKIITDAFNWIKENESSLKNIFN
ncbi:MAG: GDP-mannose 4,6-dehydratase [Chitinophagaceae bacterium]|nr:GDP-mannose 4,6-dehydratase [Chitinophagaceae bacterium]